MNTKSTIKTTSLLLAFLVSFSINARSATKFTVLVSNFKFTPNSIPNVLVGDTLEWIWQTGSTAHTTTCDPSAFGAGPEPLPAGAVPWDSPMDATITTFQYIVTVPGVYNYWCIPHSGGMRATFTASNPLPVKLSAFKVSNDNNKAVLNWTTESENNIDYFSIQKSKTGENYTEIAKIPAAGNSSETRNYHYIDPNTSSSDKYGYYNIMIVDKEGKKEYSPVGLFKSKLAISRLIISLSPNPVSKSGHLLLKFNAESTGKMKVKVISLTGETVLETTMQANEGVNDGHLMLNNMAAGSYSVSFELNSLKEVYKILVK